MVHVVVEVRRELDKVDVEIVVDGGVPVQSTV